VRPAGGSQRWRRGVVVPCAHSNLSRLSLLFLLPPPHLHPPPFLPIAVWTSLHVESKSALYRHLAARAPAVQRACCIAHLLLLLRRRISNKTSARVARPRSSRLVATASHDGKLVLEEPDVFNLEEPDVFNLEEPDVFNFLTYLIGLCFEQCNIPDSIFVHFSALIIDVLLTEHLDVVSSGDDQKLRRIITSFTGTSSSPFTLHIQFADLDPV
jgi:hypothetical protein